MRIEFPNAAREDFHWAQARLCIGSAADNDLVLAASQAAAKHLCIEQDRRGWVVQVLPSADRIYVNARPVRERALLRAGDVVSVGDCRLLLCDDEDPALRAPHKVAGEGCCTAALRAVAGPLSGRVLPLRYSLELGPGGSCALGPVQGEAVGLRVRWKEGRILLEDICRSSRHPVRVNGVVVQNVALLPGDQIGVAMHRFVLEAPGTEAEPGTVLLDERTTTNLPEAAAGPIGEVWWLIVTAAVLALGIALVLLIRF
ncbi:MAG: FHA domain-containing protein [Rhodanobacter sp.]|nr:MAG: FHA domain-containing protein [Rhodanobacter sp.]TAL91988.1 MAG: FHA domain-containing protein [Rhodanobacter sp.]TAM42473.1 MAG: FHA domain-containing protein [Rhodanobacter sp.]TAN26131.1 MAG: FHA domain-containing protein [Rhodanobacter sp.]